MSSPASTVFPQYANPPPQVVQQPVTNTPGWNRYPGAGKRTPIPISNPAAGSDIKIVVPGGVMWRLISLRAKLTTSSAVANRLVGFQLDDGNPGYTASPAYETDQDTTNLAASSNRVFELITAHAANLETNVLISGNVSATRFFVPEFVILQMGLLPGHRLLSKTTAIDVGDQWSNVQLFVEEVIIQ